MRDRADGTVSGRFAGRTITLGVASGIACYRAIDLMRDLQREGARVRPLLTNGAAELVRPALFEALSGERVGRSLWSDWPDRGPGDAPYGRFPHLDFARGVDAVVIAPATANSLAKAAAGIADDLLSTTLVAVDPLETPTLFVPSMNATMWRHPATSENRATLRERGAWVITPDEGPLACGEYGPGRWPGSAAISAALDRLVNGRGLLAGRRVVVTAGRTEVDLDPARTLSNRSTGKMGFAVARAAWREGAEVTLVHGVTALEPPPFVRTLGVRTPAELSQTVRAEMRNADQLWMAAAVSDYRPRRVSATKLKKAEWDGTLELEPTEDVLARVAAERETDVTLVGFAVETGRLEEKAVEKLESKGCEWIVANDPTEEGAGFASDTNRVVVVGRDGSRRSFDTMSKDALARELIELVAEREGATETAS